jgi:hypothetical protein
LANNASVLTRLIDSAEDEEYKEAMLAYFFLWRAIDDPEPWDTPKLDARIESFLEEKTGIEINFEVADALDKLFRLGLAWRDPRAACTPAPLPKALKASTIAGKHLQVLIRPPSSWRPKFNKNSRLPGWRLIPACVSVSIRNMVRPNERRRGQ